MALRSWSAFDVCFVAALALHLGIVSGRTLSAELQLKDKLFGNRKFYNIHTRPSVHTNQSSVVDLGLSLISIIDLDEETETLITNSWFRMVWYDYSLHWNEEDYGGIGVIRQHRSLVWTPDIVLSNSEIADNSWPKDDVLLLIYPNGEVLWVPPMKTHTTCRVQLKDFPFDEHVCQFHFRSFSHEGHVLRLRFYNDKTYIDMSDYWVNEKWDVTHYPMYVEHSLQQHDEIHLSVHLKRRGCFYVFTIFVPLVFSWALLLVLFWLPPMANEKVTLGSFALLYHVILLAYLQWIIPHNGSEVPRIVIFSSNSLIFAGLSLILSTVTITMSRSVDTFMVPHILGQLLSGWFGTLLCLGPSTKGVSMGAKLLTSSNVELSVSNSDSKEDSCGVSQQGYSDWALMALALDRIFFIIYCFSFGGLMLAYAFS